MASGGFNGKVAIIQRVLADYRAEFFDLLATRCPNGVTVAAGRPRREEGIAEAAGLNAAHRAPLRNIHLLRGPFYSCWQRGVAQWLRRLTPDVLVVEANPRLLSTRRAFRVMRERDKPVIGWGLGTMEVTKGLAVPRGWWRARFLRRFDAMLAYSSRAREEYIAAGMAAERVFVVNNAVSRRPMTGPPARTSGSWRRGRVLFVGRLVAPKRLDSLLLACARLEATQAVRLTIVGDGPARAEWERLAAEVFPAARFVGEKRGRELDSYWDDADLFVLPGQGGLAVQQAMGHGLPVIVADGDGTQGDLVTPRNGWLVRAGDLEELTGAMRDAFSRAESLGAMGAASYRLVAEKINIETMVESFLAALSSVCEHDRGEAAAS